MARELTVSTADVGQPDVILQIAPQHPAAHGALRLALTLEGEQIVHAVPIVGYMHRGAEKLFEARDYRQILVLANRHDWLAAFSNELGVAIAVERLLGIDVPVRAVWARTMLAELNRVLSHLLFLASAPGADRDTTATVFGAREMIQALMEEVSGGRMHFMFNQVGGLKQDLPTGWLDRAALTIDRIRRLTVPAFLRLLESSEPYRGIGSLDRTICDGYGVSGPIARASGIDMDLRRDDPTLAYDLLPAGVLRVVTRVAGDCVARLECLVDQVEVSLDIAEYCRETLATTTSGPINVRLPKVVKAPEGETYAWTENPLGINGYYLVSRGQKTPWRLKVRTASFANVQVLPHLLTGASVGDLVPILTTLFFVVGDIDK